MRQVLLLLVFMLWIPRPAYGVIGEGAPASSFVSGATPATGVSFNLTCTNTNPAIYVGVHIRETSTTPITVTALTYGTLTLSDFTVVASRTSPSAVGAKNLTLIVLRALPGAVCNSVSKLMTITISEAKIWGAGAVPYTGVNQSDPEDDPVITDTNGTPAGDGQTSPVTSAVGDLVLGWLVRRNTQVLVTDAGQTDKYNFTNTVMSPASSSLRGIGATKPGAATPVEIGWTIAGTQEWIAIGLNVNAAGTATTYWVAKTGNDSNSCSQATSESTPRLTITNGAACLSPGDTLRIKAGTYAEQFVNEIPGGTSWSAPVTVRADTAEIVTIQPGDVPQGGAFIFTTAASQYIILESLILSGLGQDEGSGIIIDNEAHHIRVYDTQISGFWNQGILVSTETGAATGFGNNNEFLNLYVNANGTAPHAVIPDNQKHGLYIETDNNLLADCHVANHTGHGIHIYSSHAWQPNDNMITRTKVEQSGTMGVGLYGGSGNTLINSLIFNNGDTGVKVQGTNADVSNDTITQHPHFGIFVDSGTGHDIRNNIITESDDWGLWLDTGVTGLTVQNNLFHTNTDGNIDNDAGATVTGTVTGDPLFVNAAGQDFHLQAGSPARDVGITISAITDDLGGTPRPQNSIYDIGAYEFVVVTAPRRPTGLQYRFLDLFDRLRLWRFS